MLVVHKKRCQKLQLLTSMQQSPQINEDGLINNINSRLLEIQHFSNEGAI